MVIRKNKNLGFASEPTKSTRMQDAITIALETCAVRIRLFLDRAVTSPNTFGGERREKVAFSELLLFAREQFIGARARP